MTIDEAIDYFLDEFSIADSVYTERDRIDDQAWFDKNPDKSSWDHPSVLKFNAAVEALEDYRK